MILNSYYYKSLFRKPAGTSRGVLLSKVSIILELEIENSSHYGECSFLGGLSSDTPEQVLAEISDQSEELDLESLEVWKINTRLPSLKFALETILASYQNGINNLFNSGLYNNSGKIGINGLIWMGDKGFMKQQISNKINDGNTVLKLKIGNLNWDEELDLLKFIRKEFSAKELEIRVDANGAFEPKETLQKLDDLAKLAIHSIEQPIQPEQFSELKSICAKSPIPIALDEELIKSRSNKYELISFLKPHYIILKPGLIGGFGESTEWIKAAEACKVDYWITSALETNIGLNALAHFTYRLKLKNVQGLGTGSLFTNPIPSPLTVEKSVLSSSKEKRWDFSGLSTSK